MNRITPQEHVCIAPHTTFKVGGLARFFFEIRHTQDMYDAVSFAHQHAAPLFLLGGGSNVLVSDSGLPGCVIRVALEGITVCAEDAVYVYVDAAAGVVWDDFVSYVTARGWWGIENMSGIPGTVAGGVVGNIGAYGQEVKDVVDSVTFFDTKTGTVHTVTSDACRFGYRTSVFKSRDGRQYMVMSVRFRLYKKGAPHCLYKDIQEYLAGSGVRPVLSQHMRDIVSDIRAKKLPDWRTVPSAGSYFKNPVIDRSAYEALTVRYPRIPVPRDEGTKVKLSAAWLIDKVCHLRGYVSGNVATHDTQALVIVNRGGATAQEIKSFGDMIVSRVYEATGIILEREVELLGNFL